MPKETVIRGVKDLHQKKYTIVNEDGIRKSYLDPVVASKIEKRIPEIKEFAFALSIADDVHFPIFIYLDPAISDKEIAEEMEGFLFLEKQPEKPLKESLLYSCPDFMILESQWGITIGYSSLLGYNELPKEANYILWSLIGGEDVHKGRTVCLGWTKDDLNGLVDMAQKNVEIIKGAMADPDGFIKQYGE